MNRQILNYDVDEISAYGDGTFFIRVMIDGREYHAVLEEHIGDDDDV